MSSSSPLHLRGITWNHTRGYLPMVATAQRFEETHPGVRFTWEKHSLKDFEDFPLEQLAAEFDLVVLDHPSIPRLARAGILLPLDEHLPAAFLADQAANTVGASHRSYQIDGHQWGLATDAATPVAFWREDLLAVHGLAVPSTWEELLELARAGCVEIPAAPINCLMNFYSLCLAVGDTPFTSADRLVSPDIGRHALVTLRQLLQLCDPACLTRNPIASHDLVASAANTRLAYCPLAYGYSNYAREGYAEHRLRFGEVPTLGGQPLRTTLGGAGLALFAGRPSEHTAASLAYTTTVASAEVQRTLYTHAGGQPGHRSAWTDPTNNALTRDYFTATLPVLDRAYLRPQFAGYIPFQAAASDVLHEALRGTRDDTDLLTTLDRLYVKHLSAS